MNTQSLLRAVVALVVTVFCFTAPKAFSYPFTDPLNYPLGNLAGNTNSETNAWAPMGTNGATGTTDVTVTNVTLNYPGLSCPGTNSVLFGNLGYTERIPVHATNANGSVFAQSSGTIYYSYVFVVTNLGSATTGGGFMTAFTTVTGPSATEPSVGGARCYVRVSPLNGAPNYNLGITKSSGTNADISWSTNEFVVGQTNFVVASYTFLTGAANNDSAQLWINPAAGNFGAPAAPAADLTNALGADIQVGGANQIESFYFRQGNVLIPYVVAADLRIGTNWSDVTPPAVVAAPPLSVTLTSPNVVLTWPTNFSGFRLQGTPVLIGGSNAWTNVTASTNVVGTNYSVTDPVAGTNFYRLSNP